MWSDQETPKYQCLILTKLLSLEYCPLKLVAQFNTTRKIACHTCMHHIENYHCIFIALPYLWFSAIYYFNFTSAYLSY